MVYINALDNAKHCRTAGRQLDSWNGNGNRKRKET